MVFQDLEETQAGLIQFLVIIRIILNRPFSLTDPVVVLFCQTFLPLQGNPVPSHSLKNTVFSFLQIKLQFFLYQNSKIERMFQKKKMLEARSNNIISNNAATIYKIIYIYLLWLLELRFSGLSSPKCDFSHCSFLWSLCLCE